MPDRRRARRACAPNLRGQRSRCPYGWLRLRRRSEVRLVGRTGSRSWSSSSMTCRATGELLNTVLGDQPLTQFELVRGRLILDAEDGFTRPHVAFGTAVAVDAPVHLERLFLPHQRHSVDLSVTSGAPHSLFHVNAVIEVHKVWQIVDAGPGDGAVGSKALPHWFEIRARREDLRVAVHARLGWGNAGQKRLPL